MRENIVANMKTFIFLLFTVKVKLISSCVLRYDFSQWEKPLYFTQVYKIIKCTETYCWQERENKKGKKSQGAGSEIFSHISYTSIASCKGYGFQAV